MKSLKSIRVLGLLAALLVARAGLCQNPTKEYYALLQSLNALDAHQQIEKLDGFLKHHPQFLPVFFKINERFLVTSSRAQSLEYFEKLSHNQTYQKQSLWILAHLFRGKDDSSSYRTCLSQAMLAEQDTFRILEVLFYLFPNHILSLSETSRALADQIPIETHNLLDALVQIQLAYFPRAIALLNQLPPDYQQHPFILECRGYCYYRLSQYENAEKLWKQGLDIARQTDHLEWQARFINRLGNVVHAHFQIERAKSLYDQAWEIAQRIDDIPRKTNLLHNYGILELLHSNYDQGTSLCDRAITLAQQMDDAGNMAHSYYNRAQLFDNNGKKYQALKDYHQCEKIAKQIGDELLDIRANMLAAQIQLFWGLCDVARNTLSELYEKAVARDWESQQTFLDLEINKAFFQCNEVDAGIHHAYEVMARKSGKLRETDVSYFYYCIGRGYLKNKNYAAAIPALKKAVFHATQDEYVYYWNAAELYLAEMKSGQVAYAIGKLKTILRWAEEHADEPLRRTVWLYLGDSYLAQNDLPNAITFYRRAWRSTEESRAETKLEDLQIGFVSKISEIYQKLIECYYLKYQRATRASDLDSLFYFSEMYRARALKEQIFKRRIEGPLRTLDYDKARAELNLFQANLRHRLSTGYEQFDWSVISPEWHTLKHHLLYQRLKIFQSDSVQEDIAFEPPQLATILGHLKENRTALLLYHVSERHPFVLVANGDTTIVQALGITLAGIHALVDSLVRPFHAIQDRDIYKIPFRADVAFRLYRALFEPIAAWLQNQSQVLIVPDESLMNLPFGLLLSQKASQPVYSPADPPDYNDAFLLNQYVFCYSPTSLILQRPHRTPALQKGLFAVANPVASQKLKNTSEIQLRLRTGWRFDPLPATEVETHKIADLFRSRKILKRNAAQESTFLKYAPAFPVIHIASHAFADTASDAFSGLVLASKDSLDDGILMGYEIAGLKLNCDLVTLSACETGRGRLIHGEGVLGLPRRFLGAGAATVLMSLWKVDDQFTARLMPLFYRHYLSGRHSKASALTQAARDCLKETIPQHGLFYQHPFFWASFSVYGHPGFVEKKRTYRTFYLVLLLIALIAIGLLYARSPIITKRGN